MSKIRKAVQSIFNIAAEPSLLNLVLKENKTFKKKHFKKYPNLMSLPQISLKDIDRDFNTKVDMFFLDGGSLPTDLSLLKTLAKNKNSYFEIGTWRGESVWNVATEIEDCTTFNLSKDEMIALGLEKNYAELHGILSRKNPKILHIDGNTLSYDFASLNKKYDLIFIDGDHSYEMVLNDTQKVLKHLVHNDTVVVWHDYAFNPENVRYEVFTAILDALPQEFHKNLYHVANTMCAVLTTEKFEAKAFESPKNPDFLFEVSLSIKK